MRRLPHVRRVVLSCLAAAPNHGYGVILWASSVSPDDRPPSVGSVYGAIDVLEADGLIELHESRVENGRTRRVMRVTPDGLDRLSTEIERLHRELAATPIGKSGAALGGAGA